MAKTTTKGRESLFPMLPLKRVFQPSADLLAAVVVARQGVLPAEVDVLRLEGVEAAHGPVALVPVPGVPE